MDDGDDTTQRHVPDHPYGGPTTVAGGWQGLDIVNKTTSAESSNKTPEEEEEETGRVARLVRAFPRAYNLFFKIIIPLFVLIFLCFLFGAGLARLESGVEMAANDQVMADLRDFNFIVRQLTNNAVNAPEICLNRYNDTSELLNRTELLLYMKECERTIALEEEREFAEALLEYFLEQETEALTFDWMTCVGDNATSDTREDQVDHFVRVWVESYLELRDQYRAAGMSVLDAHDAARAEATGSSDCETNGAAGALFWFTVMTTIGYGHTAPVTPGGRAMVYTLGFLSILVFTALIGQAGYICLTIIDDLFLRCRWHCLTKGPLSVLFWAFSMVLWMLIVAAIFVGWSRSRGNNEATLKDTYWFTYISTTTVGLGDLYIPAEKFEGKDLFVIPLLFLVGFVFLANFLLKLSDLLVAWMPHKRVSLEQMLEETRESPRETELQANAQPDASLISSDPPTEQEHQPEN